MSQEIAGIRLRGGPGKLDGWSNAYRTEGLGGWPLPDRIAAFEVMGVVAVAPVDNVPEDFRDVATYYRKVGQSALPDGYDDLGGTLVRGAYYKVEEQL